MIAAGAERLLAGDIQASLSGIQYLRLVGGAVSGIKLSRYGLDRGAARVLAGTILIYAIFTGAAALSQNIWELAIFRLLAGMGVGGEWSLAGTYVAEAWPEEQRL
ncbi:MAG: MFS transporter [Candidatus Acidiferrales bacterium]